MTAGPRPHARRARPRPAATAFDAEPVDSEHPLFVAYTSGTTGRPKGAVHVHGGFLVKIAEEVAFQIDLRPGRARCSGSPTSAGSWGRGRSSARSRTAARSCCTTARPTIPGPTGCGRWSSGTASTMLGVSPTLVRALMAHGDEPVRAHDLSSLRVLASTGEPWNEGPWRWYFERRRRRPLPGHQHLGRHRGRRVLPVAARRRSRSRRARSAARRSAWPSTCSTTTAGPVRGEVGELVCTKPWPGMTRGLWRTRSATSRRTGRAGPDVWWHGDFASVDRDDGQWFLHGRSDDTIKLAGKRLGPAEVETVAGRAPGGRRSGGGRCARRAEGRGAVGVRGARRRASSRRRRCAPSCARCVADAARAVVQAGRGAVHDARCRRRAARR